MIDFSDFSKRATILKNIFLIILIGVIAFNTYALITAMWEMTPFSKNASYEVSFITDSLGNKLATRIDSSVGGPYVQITRNIMAPTNQFIVPISQAFARIKIIGVLYRLPLMIVLWIAFIIFKDLSSSRTPFAPELFSKIKNIGKILFVYGLTGTVLFSLLITFFVTGIVRFDNPINFYLILIGFILHLVSEILEYGLKLQTEVDELL